MHHNKRFSTILSRQNYSYCLSLWATLFFTSITTLLHACSENGALALYVTILTMFWGCWAANVIGSYRSTSSHTCKWKNFFLTPYLQFQNSVKQLHNDANKNKHSTLCSSLQWTINFLWRYWMAIQNRKIGVQIDF